LSDRDSPEESLLTLVMSSKDRTLVIFNCSMINTYAAAV